MTNANLMSKNVPRGFSYYVLEHSRALRKTLTSAGYALQPTLCTRMASRNGIAGVPQRDKSPPVPSRSVLRTCSVQELPKLSGQDPFGPPLASFEFEVQAVGSNLAKTRLKPPQCLQNASSPTPSLCCGSPVGRPCTASCSSPPS